MVFISKAGSFDIWVGPNGISPGHGQTRNVLEMKLFYIKLVSRLQQKDINQSDHPKRTPRQSSLATHVIFIPRAKLRHQWLKSYLNVFSYTRRYRRMNSISRLCLFFQSNIFFSILEYYSYDSISMTHTDSPVSKMLQRRKQR